MSHLTDPIILLGLARPGAQAPPSPSPPGVGSGHDR
jgi:hypothetical protein